jgi:hypothetical protein
VKTQILTIVAFILSTAATAGSSLKLEGTCTGTSSTGSAISFSYYSSFDGCKKISDAAITFTSGIVGHFKGERSFTDSQDIYVLSSGYKLIYANSTGNTSGSLTYPVDSGRKMETISTQCKIRDYEYQDC